MTEKPGHDIATVNPVPAPREVLEKSGLLPGFSAKSIQPRKLWLGVSVALLAFVVMGAFFAARAKQAQMLADKQWNDLQARGILRVGIDPGWQPFSFYDATGWQGLDADLTREIARRMNLRIQATPVGYDSLYDALHLWQVDVDVSAVVADPSRGDEYAFSEPYIDAGLYLVSPLDNNIRSVNDLSNKQVAVALGSDADRVARYWARRLANVARTSTNDDAGAIAKVQTRQADAAIVPWLTVARLRVQGVQWRYISISAQPYTIAVRRDNSTLLIALNQTLDQMRADGTLDAIVARWSKGK
jgi:ABC-type amino acid transport substrate-binding protein